jgi:hypothetical protein
MIAEHAGRRDVVEKRSIGQGRIGDYMHRASDFGHPHSSRGKVVCVVATLSVAGLLLRAMAGLFSGSLARTATPLKALHGTPDSRRGRPADRDPLRATFFRDRSGRPAQG